MPWRTQASGAFMPVRLGIEISPGACRVVRIERTGGADGDTIVQAFAHTAGPDELTLAPYRGQPVAVVMWGLRGDHRQAVVTRGSYQRMRREAVNATRHAGVDTRLMLADIAPVTAAKGRDRRCPVVIALARTSDVSAALARLTSVGVRARSIVTPALALMSLARLRRRLTPAGMAEAYVALEETSTALALIRDGALVAARELPWGYQDEQRQVRSRDEVSQQLGAAIEAFFGDCGARLSAVAQVCVCGGMPEMRSMTLALTERLDVEVEPLDSLFGIDAGHLPSDDFRERVADTRLAWAAAADWGAPINFLRERRRRLVKTVLTRAAVVAGVATGLGIAWRIQHSALLEAPRPAAKPAVPGPVVQRPRPVPPPLLAPALGQTPAESQASPPAQVSVKPTESIPAASAAVSPLPALVLQRPPERPIQQAAKPPVEAPPAPRAERVPQPLPPVQLTAVPEPARSASPREPQTATAVAPPAVRRPAPEEVPLPFEAALGTILYGADRRLAIIDGRIVQVGDEVRGARVVEITPNSVLFRDRESRLRRLTLTDRGR